jgi:hypothetical protein
VRALYRHGEGAAVLLLWLRHDVESFPLPPHRRIWTNGAARMRLRGNLVVFLLCIPAGYVLAGKRPDVLVLSFFSSRAAPAWRRWQRRGSE